jgi:hypothetical protein
MKFSLIISKRSDNTRYAHQRDQHLYSVLYDPCINRMHKIMEQTKTIEYTKISCINLGVRCLSKNNFSIFIAFVFAIICISVNSV